MGLGDVGRAVDFLRRKGVGGLGRRLRAEMMWPKTAVGRALNSVLRPAASLVGPAGSLVDRGTLVAFYDLETMPLTGDAAWFACAAALRAREAGLQRIVFVVVPDGGTLRIETDEYLTLVDAAARKARVHDFLLPIFRSIDACAGAAVLPAREAAWSYVREARTSRFPVGYLPSMPVVPGRDPATDNAVVGDLLAAARAGAPVTALNASLDMLGAAREWIQARFGDRRVVTITLRDYAYAPERNSDLESWARLAAWLNDSGLVPVVLPDHAHRALPEAPGFAGFPHCFPAVWSLPFRLALYEVAHLNLGVNNGPMALCWLNSRVRSLTFKLAARAEHTEMEAYQAKLGFEPGKQLPFGNPFQRWIWADDDFDTLIRETQRMLGEIDLSATTRSTS
jgi:hypothetical protein